MMRILLKVCIYICICIYLCISVSVQVPGPGPGPGPVFVFVGVSAQRLFFSKYIAGTTSTTNAVEIYNPSCQTVSLSEFHIMIARNSGIWSLSTQNLVSLSGSMSARSSHVLCRTAAGVSGCTQIDSNFAFDGDDAIVLVHNWIPIDVIGGEFDSTTGNGAGPWDVAGVHLATAFHTLHRKPSVIQGRTRWPALRTTNSSLYSEWNVLAVDDISNLGTHSIQSNELPSCPTSDARYEVRRLTCGTIGSSSILNDVSSDLQVECPSDCHTRPYGVVFGGLATKYTTSSYVCNAAVHAGAVVLDSWDNMNEPLAGDGNTPDTSAWVNIAASYESSEMLSSPLDIVIVLDGSTATTSMTSVRAWLTAMIELFAVDDSNKLVRIGVIQYANTAVQESALQSDRVTLESDISATNMPALGTTNRDVHTGLASALSMLQSSARGLDPRAVIVLSSDSFSNTALATTAADNLDALGTTVIVVSVGNPVSAGRTTQALAVSTSTEHHITTNDFTTLVSDTPLQLQQLLWQQMQCTTTLMQPMSRPLFTYSHITSSFTVTGSDPSRCVVSRSLSSSASSGFSVSALSRSNVQCLNSCSGTNGYCNQRTGLCTCASGFSGDDCSVHACPTCYNGGSCNAATGECTCTGVYSGAQCLSKSCAAYSDCNSHGVCDTETGLCQCHEGYYGVDCSLQTCENDCHDHGRCDPTSGSCICYSGYTGRYCSLTLCPSDCSGHGVCDLNTGICTCDALSTSGSHGDCVHGRCPNDCSGHGVCASDTRTCTCSDGYVGYDCSVRSGA
jgi:von Willebrand factor type A domain/EGF-like domain